MILKRHANGTVVADGSEQDVTEIGSLAKFSGYIDLSAMEAGDEVVTRQYMRIRSGGSYKKYGEATYSGVQDPPLLYMTVKVLSDGAKITVQQTAGTCKSFPFCFVREEE